MGRRFFVALPVARGLADGPARRTRGGGQRNMALQTE